MGTDVVVAAVAAAPPTMMAVLAWVQARRASQHGRSIDRAVNHRPGDIPLVDMVAETRGDVRRIGDIVDDIRQVQTETVQWQRDHIGRFHSG